MSMVTVGGLHPFNNCGELSITLLCGYFKMFHISASEFGIVSMRTQFRTCTYKYVTTVIKSVVHSVHKELDILPLCHKVAYKSQMVVEGQGHFAKHL